MWDVHHAEAAAIPPLDATSGAERRTHQNLDRRRAKPGAHDAFRAALDELDYGVLLLAADGEVLHCNHAAAAQLREGHPLQCTGRHLQARCAADAVQLQAALRNASRRGLRKLVLLGTVGERVGVSVVPLATAAGPVAADAAGPVLVVLGRQFVGEPLSVQGFAASHALTPAEARVLAALCSGLSPTRIAEQMRVAVSTVRTQIGTIRVKTGSESIRALVAKVACLPPLMGTLRQPTPRPTAVPGRPDSPAAWMQ